MCRVLAADVREVYSSICQLFELFLLEVFRSFSDVPLAQIVGETPTSQTSVAAPTAPQPDEVSACLLPTHSLGRLSNWPLLLICTGSCVSADAL